MGVEGITNGMAGLAGDLGGNVETISQGLTAGNLSLGEMIAMQIKLQMATAKLDIVKGAAKVLTGQMSKIGQEIKQIG